jgi:xanthine/uracil/vitamin C permease (AzgA family)
MGCLLQMQERVRRDLVTATAASSLIASLLMGAGANLPVACAPGMGLNAYFGAQHALQSRPAPHLNKLQGPLLKLSPA